MQSFDRQIHSLIFSGNKATVKNKFDNCEEYVINCCRNVFDPTCSRGYCVSKTPINADVSNFKNFEVQYLNNQTSDNPGP